MNTEPIKEEVIEDWSAVEQAEADGKQRDQRQFDANIEEQLTPVKAQAEFDRARGEAEIARGVGDRRLRTGGALMAGGVGVAAIIAAASLWHRVEIIHDIKLVDKIVYVDKPVVTEKVVTVDRPVVVEKERVKVERVEIPAPPPVPVAQRPEPQPVPPPVSLKPPPPPPPANNIVPDAGEQLTPEQFKGTPMYRTAQKCAGKLVSHIRGVLTFADGSKCYDAYSDGTVDPSTTTSRHNGDLVTCNDTGRVYPSGKPEKNCFALHNGTVEDVRDATRSQRAGVSDPFADLFGP